MAFLAIGYFAGGWLAGRIDAVRCHAAFYVAPAVSCLANVIACLAYPWLFPRLAAVDLVLGCVAAATVLLAVPLVVLSAMKMEHKLTAGIAGVVRRVVASEGGTYDQGVVLVEVEAKQ